MRIRFYHARILTMTEGEPVFEGEVHVEGNRIVYVGPEREQEKKFDREIDCERNLLMPGFKNAHTHSAMTFLRSFADDLPLQEWLYHRIFPMEAKLQEGDIEAFARVGILEYLSSGITSNFDMYVDNFAHARASVDMGFRTVFCGEMNDFTGSLERTREEYEKLNEMNPLVSFRLGVHAEYTTGRKLLEGMADLAHEYKEPVYLHLSETEKEVRECKERYGLSPVQFLDSIGMFDYGGGGFHGVWMSEKDMEICAEKNVSIVTNPCSNAKLASGIADLIGLQEHGVNLAIGTDGPASNNALDMFREMYLAAVLQKLKRRDASAMDAGEVLRMATVGGSRAMGLSDCETVAEGQLADLVLLDLHRPNMQPENNLVKNLVYSGSKENVKMTMVDGKILYEDG
ncbi:MAG: amidohydrolase, partial [Eubacterium sp.]|nr:amidohydrolase [Eubacterium sp.]